MRRRLIRQKCGKKFNRAGGQRLQIARTASKWRGVRCRPRPRRQDDAELARTGPLASRKSTGDEIQVDEHHADDEAALNAPAAMECAARCHLQTAVCQKSYTRHEVHGFRVWIDGACDSDEVLALLGEDVGSLAKALPPAAIQVLKDGEAEIWVNQALTEIGDSGERVTRRGAVSHYSAGWLAAHGNLPAKAGSVEVYCWEHYKTWNLRRTGTLAHEMAHLYHFHLGFGNREVKAAFKLAMDSKKYEKVPHCSGDVCRAYACTNAKEFFASLCVPYFGFRNDYYPFTREEELEDFDPGSLAMLDRVWAAEVRASRPERRSAKRSIPVLCAEGGAAGWVGRAIRLIPTGQPRWSLDVLPKSRSYRLIARARGHYTGMQWKLVPADDEGYYGLITKFTGPELPLDLSNPGEEPMMREKDDVSGQRWKLREVGRSTFRLSTLWLGASRVLACDKESGKCWMMAEEEEDGGGGLSEWMLEDYG